MVIDKHISQFKVAMYDPLRMNIDHRFHDLADIDSGFELSEPFSSFGEVFEGVVAAVLKQNIDVFFVLEGIYKLDYVFVLERFVNFDFDE